MNKIYIFLAFITIPFFANSQTYKEAPPKTSRIHVKNNLTRDENFKLLGEILLENGWLINSKDKEFYTIRTDYKEFGKRKGRISLNFFIKDNEIIVSGKLFWPTVFRRTIESSFLIKKKGSDESPVLVSFEKMFDFALLIPHSNLEYQSE